MKHAVCTAVFVLALVGTWSPSALAERDDTGHTATRTVDLKTKLMKASVKRETYGIEGKDWNVPQTTEIRASKLHAPTPRLHALARTVTTKAVHELLTGVEPPVLVDVLGDKGRRTVPGAIWLKGAGRSTDREEDIDDRLGAKLDEITEGDKARSIGFFCLSAKCWLSHNAALRAIALGYENVHWYRGGIKAWKKARLPTEKARKTTW